MARTNKRKPLQNVYQFKITLLHTAPPIWRRIQVQDCTLDTLHHYIQAAMGWSNSHLHHFIIQGEYACNPESRYGFDDDILYDSTSILLSDFLPETGRSIKFKYEYDFGDGWMHEIKQEKIRRVDPNALYPRCLEGERACPPEDCGGVWGYIDFLEAIGDPEHPEHESILEWIGGEFDPDAFDVQDATQTMRYSLPNWNITQ